MKTPHVLYGEFSNGLEHDEEESSKEARQKYPPLARTADLAAR
jgi:hypothetical protein